jgi:hypothetical protein
VLIGLEASLFARRADLEMTVLRVPGLLFQKQQDGRISNLYNIQIANKTFNKATLTLTSPLEGVEIKLVGGKLYAEPATKSEAVVFVIIPKTMATGAKIKIPLVATDGHGNVVETNTTFFSPGQ